MTYTDDAGEFARTVGDAYRRLGRAQAAVLETFTDQRLLRDGDARLDDFRRALDDVVRAVEGASRKWAAQGLADAFVVGVDDAGRGLPRSRGMAAGQHMRSVVDLGHQAHADVMRRLRETQRRGEAFIRAAKAVPRGQVRPRPKPAAARKLAARFPVDRVVYRGGARVPAGVWAEAAAQAQAQTAYNAGALNRARESGVQWVDVIDGADCGWTGHRDPDKARGTVRSVEDAAQWPISHPRCSRAFLPRMPEPAR